MSTTTLPIAPPACNLIKHQANSLVCRVAQWAGLFFTGIVTLDFVTWIGQEKMSRRVTKILPAPSTSGMMSKTMGNHQKFATTLDIYFWTSKHGKTHKIDKNWEKSHPLTTLFVGFWALESDF